MIWLKCALIESNFIGCKWPKLPDQFHLHAPPRAASRTPISSLSTERPELATGETQNTHSAIGLSRISL